MVRSILIIIGRGVRSCQPLMEKSYWFCRISLPLRFFFSMYLGVWWLAAINSSCRESKANIINTGRVPSGMKKAPLSFLAIQISRHATWQGLQGSIINGICFQKLKEKGSSWPSHTKTSSSCDQSYGWGISDRKKKLWNPEVHRMHFLMPINSLQSELPRNLSLSRSVELINLSQDTSITGKNKESCITKNAREFSSPKMRPAPIEKEAANISHLSPPPPLPSRPSSCDPQVQSCKWWPYSNSNDVGASTATILMILLCALICALAFNTAIRWFLRSDHDSSSDHLREHEEQRKPKKESDMASLVLATTQLYSAGLKLGGAEADCAICLSEFEEGEGIRVLGRCNHGFHVHCVEKWLSSHSSCPTCRCSCLASSLSSPEAADCCARNGLDNNSSQSAEPERAPDNLSANENIHV